MMAEPVMRRLMGGAAAATLIGGGAAIWGYFAAPDQFYSAWLAGFWFLLSLPLGALALLMIWDLTGGAWEAIARLPLAAMAATMPLFILYFLPVIAGMQRLYPWLPPEAAPGLHNHWYLNSEFFFIRAAVYLVLWNGFAAWRVLRPALPDGEGAPGSWQLLSAIGLALLGFSVTFASFDWLMSTEPSWFSSIYGMNSGAGQMLVCLAAAVILIALAGPPRGMARDAFAQRLASLVMILLAVLVFWAYTAFSQWLIIWEENLRTEIRWYVERWRGAWASVLYGLALAHFLVPFMCLVWTPAKRRPGLVASMGLLLMVSDLVYVWWLLLPSLQHARFTWLHPLVALGMGGLWLLLALAALRLRFAPPVLPRRSDESLIHG